MKLNTESQSCLEASLKSLVSRLVSQDDNLDSSTNAISGLKCAGSFARLDPAGCWLKTSRDSSASVQTTLFSAHGESLEMFSGTWPKWGIVSDGVAIELQMSEYRTNDSECSSWPTPKGSPSGPDYARVNRPKSGGDDLATAVARKLWATPASADAVGSHGGGQGRSLRTDIHNLKKKNWPTPRASEHKGTGPLGSKSQAHRLEKGYLNATVQEAEQQTGQLNPAWEEALMGFPIGYTDVGPPDRKKTKEG